MFSHYFIIISINPVTVAFDLVHAGGVNHIFAGTLMIISGVIFHISIMVNKEYYGQNIKLTKKDILEMIIVFVIAQALF